MTEEEEWYRVRPPDETFNKLKDELWWNGLSRTAQLKKMPNIGAENYPPLWVIWIEGNSPLKLPDKNRDDQLHVSLAFEDEISEEHKKELIEKWGKPRKVNIKIWRISKGGTAELRTADCDIGSDPLLYEVHRKGHYWRRDLHISF